MGTDWGLRLSSHRLPRNSIGVKKAKVRTLSETRPEKTKFFGHADHLTLLSMPVLIVYIWID